VCRPGLPLIMRSSCGVVPHPCQMHSWDRAVWPFQIALGAPRRAGPVIALGAARVVAVAELLGKVLGEVAGIPG